MAELLAAAVEIRHVASSHYCIVATRDAMIHNLGVSIYCHFCIMIQQYNLFYDTIKCELTDF